MPGGEEEGGGDTDKVCDSAWEVSEQEVRENIYDENDCNNPDIQTQGMPRELCLKTGCSYHMSDQDKGDAQYIYQNEWYVVDKEYIMVFFTVFV